MGLGGLIDEFQSDGGLELGVLLVHRITIFQTGLFMDLKFTKENSTISS